MPRKEEKCPFTHDDVKRALGEEVHFFTHVHMRGYDQSGEGLKMDACYYDKYGAPVNREDAWMEGYHAIELELAKHFNQCINTETDFPLVAGMSGGAHLYKPVGHDEQPWNWTGWVPRKKIWCTSDLFHRNRHFFNVRGNEIQNNLWDYHPYQEQATEQFEHTYPIIDYDHPYEQIIPRDTYRGGYWLKDNAWGRYLHIIALKSHEKVGGDRYNFIVHPLAYRGSTNDCPDNSVDAMQWSILNVKDEVFTESTWGTDVQGLELFNDFTYFYSWQPRDKVININNGTVMNNEVEGKVEYIYWFDTYPLEFGEFLLDTSLERGVYYHALAANDAFYDRDILPPYKLLPDPSARKEYEARERILLSDPKGNILKEGVVAVFQPPARYSTRMKRRMAMATMRSALVRDMRAAIDFFNKRPYTVDTAFGHVACVDTNRELLALMSDEDELSDDLDNAELKVLKWFRKGRFYSHTGVYDIFNYGDKKKQTIPFVIENQKDRDDLCYEMTEDMELVFDFPCVKDNKVKLVWRYSLQHIKENDTLESVHGYFKMSKCKPTRLNLSGSYDKTKVKWIRFTAFKYDNAQRRAWFNPIRGLHFGKPRPNEKPQTRTHRIAVTQYDITGNYVMAQVWEHGTFQPFECIDGNGKLEFLFPKCSDEEEENIYVYSMQVCAPLPQDVEDTKNSARDADGHLLLPERFLQNVNGYFPLNNDFQTKLNLSFQWDPQTVVDNKVYFYCIQAGQPTDICPVPTTDMPEGYEV